MSKYKNGDKVVIRKDLVVGEWYGNVQWWSADDFMKKYEYLIINEVDDDGDFWIEGCGTFVSEEMIAGLYKEDKEMSVKTGDKVRIIKDVRGCRTIKKGDIVEIDRIEYDAYYVKDHKFVGGTQYHLNYDEFELVEEPRNKKYVWYLDSEDGTYFLNYLLGVEKWYPHEIEEIKNGKDACYLLTEEEARKSPFFNKFKKHDPFKEKLYYILVKGQDWEDRQFLNMEVESSRCFFDNNVETDGFKITFTEKEADEIIGTSTILYKEECR